LVTDGALPVAPAVPEGVVAAAPTTRVRRERRAPFRLGIEAGGYGEVWEGAIAGGVEGQFGLRFDNRNRWEVALTGGIGRGVESSAGVRARTASVTLGIAHLPVRNLEVEAGGLARLLTLDRDTFGERHASTLGLFGAVRYVLARGRFAMAVGPHLSLLRGAMIVESDGNEVFRVPRFVTGLSLAGRADFIQ
jgi:hypothetical protein